MQLIYFSNSVTEEKCASEETQNQESKIEQIIHNTYSIIEGPVFCERVRGS